MNNPAFLEIVVPGIPPSVNHYKAATMRRGRMVYVVSPEAKRFKQDIWVLNAGSCITGESFQVEIVVYLGAKQKGDVDNFGKIVLDGIAEASVMWTKGKPVSDAHVSDLVIRKRRDSDNPRTVIRIYAEAE